MRIAFFYYNRVNPIAGGIDRVTFNLMNSLKDRGHEVFNFFYLGEGDGISHFLIPKDDSPETTSQRIDQLVKELGIQILFDQYSFDASLTHLYLNSEVKIVRCIHIGTGSTGYYTERLLRNFNFYNLKESLYNILFWVNTPRRKILSNKQLYTRSLGVDKLVLLDDGYTLPTNVDKKIVTAIPNGIPVTNYTLGSKKKQLLFVGRLVHSQKNTRFLLRIWNALYREFPDWEFVICGDGPDMPVMEAYIKRHKLERIYLKGRVNPEQYYKDASLLVLPSFFEGFPMVMLEGMQYGCIPVVFDVVTAFHKLCKDVNRRDENGEPRKCGVIVEAMNKKAYIDECRKLMRDADLCRELSLAAIDHAKDYEIEKITDQWEALFDELLAGKYVLLNS